MESLHPQHGAAPVATSSPLCHSSWCQSHSPSPHCFLWKPEQYPTAFGGNRYSLERIRPTHIVHIRMNTLDKFLGRILGRIFFFSFERISSLAVTHREGYLLANQQISLNAEFDFFGSVHQHFPRILGFVPFRVSVLSPIPANLQTTYRGQGRI